MSFSGIKHTLTYLQLASLRSRDDDRCALLLSLLGDAERLTSYINSLLYIDERQRTRDDPVPAASKNYNMLLLTNGTKTCIMKVPATDMRHRRRRRIYLAVELFVLLALAVRLCRLSGCQPSPTGLSRLLVHESGTIYQLMWSLHSAFPPAAENPSLYQIIFSSPFVPFVMGV